MLLPGTAKKRKLICVVDVLKSNLMSYSISVLICKELKMAFVEDGLLWYPDHLFSRTDDLYYMVLFD